MQINGSFLGVVSDSYAAGFNLRGSDVWNDSYTAIIQKFTSLNPPDEGIRRHINRKNLKKTIMILNYSGSNQTCLASIKESVFMDCSKDEMASLIKYAVKFIAYARAAITQKGLIFTRSVEDTGLLGGPHPVSGTAGGTTWRVQDSGLEARSAVYGDRIKKEAEGRLELLNDLLSQANGCGERDLKKLIARYGFDGKHEKKTTQKQKIDGLREVRENLQKLVDGRLKPQTWAVITEDGFYAELAYNLDAISRRDKRTGSKDKMWEQGLKAEFGHLFVHKYSGHSRQTFCERWTSQVFDPAKTKRAVRANFTHLLDSLVARKTTSRMIRKGMPCIPIHDCFGCRPHDKGELIMAYSDAISEYDVVVGDWRITSTAVIDSKWVII